MSKKVFVSHSIINPDLTNEFVRKFRNHNNDKDILWDKNPSTGNFDKIFENYAKTCDVAILLINAAFIDSTYCNEKELPLLLERQGMAKVIIIPIYFQVCTYKPWNQDPSRRLKFFPAKKGDFQSTRSFGPDSDSKNLEDLDYEHLGDRDKEAFHLKLREYIDELIKSAEVPSPSPETRKIMDIPAPKFGYQQYLARSLSMQTSSTHYSAGLVIGKEIEVDLYYVLFVSNDSPQLVSIIPTNEAKVVSTKKITDINSRLYLAMAVVKGKVMNQAKPFWEFDWAEKDEDNLTDYMVIGTTISRKRRDKKAIFYAKASIVGEKLTFDNEIFLTIDGIEEKDRLEGNLDSRMRGSIIYDCKRDTIIGVLSDRIDEKKFSYLPFNSWVIEALKNEQLKPYEIEIQLREALLSADDFQHGSNFVVDLINDTLDQKNGGQHNGHHAPGDSKKANEESNEIYPLIKEAYYFKRKDFLEEHLPVFLSTTFRDEVNCFLSILKKITTDKIGTDTNGEIQFNSRLVLTFLLLECIKKHFESNPVIKQKMDSILEDFIFNTDVGGILFPYEDGSDLKGNTLNAERKMLYELLLAGERNAENAGNRSMVEPYYCRLKKNKKIHDDVADIWLYLTLPEDELKETLHQKNGEEKNHPGRSILRGEMVNKTFKLHEMIKSGVEEKAGKPQNWLDFTKFYYNVMIRLNHMEVKRVFEVF